MKQTRLEKTVGTKTFNKLFPIYKEAKQTKDIHKILAFKSFITRIINAQNEYTINGDHRWVTLNEYLENVVLNKVIWYDDVHSPLEFICRQAENQAAFAYYKRKHLNRLL